MGCAFGESISGIGPTEFDIKFIKSQIEVATEELGDEIVEDKAQIIFFGSESLDSYSEEYYINRANVIVRCLQARYLGDCMLKKCKYKREVTELVDDLKLAL